MCSFIRRCWVESCTLPRFIDAASDVIGSPNVALHHNKLFIKPPENGSPLSHAPGCALLPARQAQHDRWRCSLRRCAIEKGCIRVVPGSHKLGPIEHQQSGGWHLPFEQYPLESCGSLPCEAGDVLFFSYLTIHGSGINVSSEARTTCLFQLRDPSDLPSVNTHLSRGQGMVLRGIDPTAPLLWL
jgi:phytanoyl-CoA hydroxylase